MKHQIVRTFDEYAAAEAALNHLLSAGFQRDLMHIDVLRDEAGPEQANFTVGDDPKVKGGTDYTKTFKPEEDHSHTVVVVDAPSASEADRAAAILAGHGAVIDDPAWRKLEKGPE
jgi:hypothetical protein